MKKAILIIAVALVLITALSVTALATENANQPAVSEEIQGTQDIGEKGAEGAQGANPQTAGEVGDLAAKEEPLLSEQLLSLVGEHVSEIFCILTFLSSAVNMYLYKKGLMPSIGNAVSKINSGANEVFERVAKYSKSTDGTIAKLEERIAPILDRVREYTDESAKMTETLDRMDSDTKRMQTLFAMQSELIYTLFMSASVPQYQKDAMAECYTKIKTLSSESEA